MSCGVSLVAKPNMMPWSPAPCRSRGSTEPRSRCSNALLTPAAMSDDCAPIDTLTPHDSPSNPVSLEV